MITKTTQLFSYLICNRRLFLILWFLIFFLNYNLQGQRPKLINYFLKWDNYSPTVNEAQELAKWDVIVLDMENQHLHKDIFSIIRNLNPKIKILAYISSQEIIDNIPEYGVLRKKLKQGISDAWWLYDNNSNRISFWTGSHMLNASTQCPQTGNYKWNSYLANFICENLLTENLWDGVFLDNCWDGLSTIDNKYPDIDRTGKSVSDTNWRDLQWILGMESLIINIRNACPNKIIIGNNGQSYSQILNGVLIENFPAWEVNWEYGISKYLNSLRSYPSSGYSSINCYNNNQFDYQKMRFGLTSCLMGDGYYSFDFGDTNHGQLWWYDEYNIDLGIPIGNPLPINQNSNNELLKNNSFENGLTSWSIDPSTDYGQIIQDNTTSHTGNFSLKCTPKNPDQYWKFTIKQIGFQVERDSMYRLGFWAKSSTRRIITVNLIQDRTPWSSYFYPRPSIQLNSEWQYYEYYLTMNNFPESTNISDASNTRISFELGWDNNIVWLDDISFTKYSNSIWKREFSNALVLCNPTKYEINYNLDNTYYHFLGNQVASINNGQPCNEVRIPPKDGMILLKSNEQNMIPLTEMSNIKIYPTITNDKLIIENSGIVKNCSLIIYSTNGQEISSHTILENKTLINISNLVCGVYIVKLTNDKKELIKIINKQ